MLSRGFIGPIGDDLPSLIPLLFGLVMFFSTFTLTFNAFDGRTAEFRDDIDAMRISRLMQSNSYIYGYADFTELCRQVGAAGVKYVAGISDDAALGKEVSDIFQVSFFADSQGNYFYCSNAETGLSSPPRVSDFISPDEARDRKLVSRIFPIVVEDNRVVKPLHLFVVAWK